MAFRKMLWKTKKEGFGVKVKVKVKNTFSPTEVKHVKVNVSVRNTV